MSSAQFSADPSEQLPQEQILPEQTPQKTCRSREKCSSVFRENFSVSHFLPRVFPQAAANSL
jgi:hypothetical protein